MRTDVSVRRAWVAVLMAAAILPTSLRAAGPTIEIPAERLTGSLSPEDKDQIKTYVKFWVKKLVEAPTAKDAFDARKKLVEGYVRFASAEYRYEYADAASREVLAALPLIAKDAAGLQTIKEIQLAAATADMPQAPSLKALLVFVASPNAGARLIGFSGMGKADLEFNVLRQGQEPAASLYAALAAAVANEKETRVLQAVLAAANLNAAPQMQGDSRLDLARLRLLEIHAKAFERLCPLVMNADPDAAAALRNAVVSLGGISDDANNKQKAVLIQQALNAAWAGVTALDPEELPGPTLTGKITMTEEEGKTLTLPGSAMVKETPVRGEYTFRVAADDFGAFKTAIEAAAGAVTLAAEKPCLNESTALLKECDKLLVKLEPNPSDARSRHGPWR
ncbi:MAG: hypothetical protein NTV86_20795 [Planctomycetota bacterium]|nr:hypothetical protein [Planctomycetota bacterium]